MRCMVENSRIKDLNYNRSKPLKPSVSKKLLRQYVGHEEYFSNLTSYQVVDFDRFHIDMTYKIYVNDSRYDEDSNLMSDTYSFYTVTGMCTEIKKLGDYNLYVKFNTKGGSTLVRGNYGLVYYCTRILH